MDEKTDIYFMTKALELAEKGRGYTSPNPMVGAVAVKAGRIIGRGCHEACGKPHAEINAINDAGDSARGADLYVTLEPCNHTGRTPPCTEKILSAGIRKVVAAMPDPNPNVTGGGIQYLKSRGVIVETGVCRSEAERQNEAFIKWVRTGSPFVIVKCASTLDGRIAARNGDSKWVSGESSRRFSHRIRHWVDGIMVGIDTVVQDDPGLTTRIEGFSGADPVRLILDSRLRIPETAKVLNQRSDAPTWIITGKGVAGDSSRSEAIRKTGAKIIEAETKDGLINLPALMSELGGMNITSILIEGGGRVIGSALKAGVADRVNLFYAPKLFGGDDGVPVCRGTGPEWMKDCIPVSDIRVDRFDDDVMIEGYMSGFTEMMHDFHQEG